VTSELRIATQRDRALHLPRPSCAYIVQVALIAFAEHVHGHCSLRCASGTDFTMMVHGDWHVSLCHGPGSSSRSEAGHHHS
jgi:hypothetical protein